MLAENLILVLILFALGFAIFLLSNLQKGILIKLFGWFVALVVMLCGVMYALKITGPSFIGKAKGKLNADIANLKNNTKKATRDPVGDLYRKSNIDKMFQEIP